MIYLDGRSAGIDLTWQNVKNAILEGHRRPKAKLSDQFLRRNDDTLLSRAAWIDGLGIGVKSVSVMSTNREHGLPSVQGGMLVFEDVTGRLEAVLDSELVTKWKTASDSVLGASFLARPEAKRLLILGAGQVGENLADGVPPV